MKTLYRLGLLGLAAVSVLSSCSDEQEHRCKAYCSAADFSRDG